MARKFVDPKLRQRQADLAHRLGISYEALQEAPENLWPVLFLEKIVGALEKVEDKVNNG